MPDWFSEVRICQHFPAHSHQLEPELSSSSDNRILSHRDTLLLFGTAGTRKGTADQTSGDLLHKKASSLACPHDS